LGLPENWKAQMRHFLNSKRLWLAGVAAVALVAAALAPVGALAAKHGHHGKAKQHRPAGAVKLPKSKIQHVKGVTCGEFGKKWVSGSIVGGYFISDAQQSLNYKALSARARGKTKSKDAALAVKYAAKAKAGQTTCNKGDSGGGGHHGHSGGSSGGNSSPGGNTSPAPLRFNLNNAVGLALSSSSGTTGGSSSGTTVSSSSSTTHQPRPAAVTAAGPEQGSGSNLQAINEAGQVSDAVSSGKAEVGSFLIAPNEKLYVMFKNPVDLSDTTKYPQPGTGCVLAQVDPASGEPTCIDNTLSSIEAPRQGGNPTISSPAVQFDNTGAIYYLGHTFTGEEVLRKWSNGTTTDLIPPAAVLIETWLVLPDGTVLLGGGTMATNTQWFREISPAGVLRELPVLAWWMAPFPDGNVYLGASGEHYGGVDFYDVSSHELSSKFWIGSSEFGGTTPPGGMFHDVSTNAPGSICTYEMELQQDPRWGNFCQDPGFGVKWSFVTNEGKDYVLATSGSPGKGTPMEFYPDVAFLPVTKITNVTVAQGVVNDLLLAGTNSQREQVLTLYNTSNEKEEKLLPGSTGDHFEIYHLNYVAKGNKVLFDGLRFSDNHYVIGEYNLSTHTVNVVATSSAKWSDLQGF
jgi:hypothetical protein